MSFGLGRQTLGGTDVDGGKLAGPPGLVVHLFGGGGVTGVDGAGGTGGVGGGVVLALLPAQVPLGAGPGIRTTGQGVLTNAVLIVHALILRLKQRKRYHSELERSVQILNGGWHHIHHTVNKFS